MAKLRVTIDDLRKQIVYWQQLGKDRAMQYQSRRPTEDEFFLFGTYSYALEAPVFQWAFDAGYDAGVKERDAFEARRAEHLKATEKPKRSFTFMGGTLSIVGEHGPEMFTPFTDVTVTPAKPDDDEGEPQPTA